jgi:hypothetical protein
MWNNKFKKMVNIWNLKIELNALRYKKIEKWSTYRESNSNINSKYDWRSGILIFSDIYYG